jgi:hypothetical protein
MTRFEILGKIMRIWKLDLYGGIHFNNNSEARAFYAYNFGIKFRDGKIYDSVKFLKCQIHVGNIRKVTNYGRTTHLEYGSRYRR